MATDSERLDWWINKCERDVTCVPVLMGTAGKWVVWDQFTGLTRLGTGNTARGAIDAAMQAEADD